MNANDPTIPGRGSEIDPDRTIPPARGPSQPHSIQPPGYSIRRELGRGGMGIVYEAHQHRANRSVALKMVLGSQTATAEEFLRFRAEAEAVARLQHPHIVAIFDVGEHEKCPYFSMEYCAGGSLSSKLGEAPLPERAAAELLMKIAKGVAAAHSSGIVHRDLKPGNILLTAEGEPKIADFGLAKVIGPGERNLTATGAVFGTPSYMAPEQASASKRIGPPADVYALGAILYELLSGRPPFRGDTPTDIILQLLAEDPIALRELNTNVSRDLEAIVEKCLDKDPLRRYSDAGELVRDLERFLNGEAVSASKSGFFGQLVGAVDRVQLQEKFASFGNVLLSLAPVMFLAEAWTTFCARNDFPRELVMVGRGIQAVLFFVLVGAFRKWNLKPNGPAERQLYATWAGYLIACFAYGFAGAVRVGLDHGRAMEYYPGFCAITALAFFTMAPSFWGYCWVIGAGWAALAFAMLLKLEWASLMFGAAWALVLLLIGLRLRAMGKKAAP